ncbi:MAG: polyphosphate kinase 2 family protein [Flavobacteriales bacterium]|nr:polyphosphate kinase 2 family protein [Flavobacteriales bacterium]
MDDIHRIVDPGPDFHVTSLATHVSMEKSESKELLKKQGKVLDELQQRLYGHARHSLLIVFQAMDAAGKDSTIRAVFSGMNPQGFLVSSFKQPTSRELAHDYLWRISRQLPMRGKIGVFNRSHYEEVLVCKVHPEYITYQNLPDVYNVSDIYPEFYQRRYRQINDFERHLHENGYTIIKFFLNVSREEQEKRFLSRMTRPEKHWKFSMGDLEERQLWPSYMDAYSDAIKNTSKPHAPWYAIPADDKDYMRATVSRIVMSTMQEMDLEYPEVTAKQIQEIEEARKILENEKVKSK